jgi:hypothetical protein
MMQQHTYEDREAECGISNAHTYRTELVPLVPANHMYAVLHRSAELI